MFRAEQEADAARRHAELLGLLRNILKKEDQIMTAISDLTAAVVALKQAVADEIADIEAALAKLKGVTDDPAVAQAVADIQASVDTMKAEHAKVNPPPVPTPAAKS